MLVLSAIRSLWLCDGDCIRELGLGVYFEPQMMHSQLYRWSISALYVRLVNNTLCKLLLRHWIMRGQFRMEIATQRLAYRLFSVGQQVAARGRTATNRCLTPHARDSWLQFCSNGLRSTCHRSGSRPTWPYRLRIVWEPEQIFKPINFCDWISARPFTTARIYWSK